METLECIFTRRSVRKFLPRDVPKEYIKAVLMAGAIAPSGVNNQPWHFIVVSGEENLRKIEMALREYGRALARRRWLYSVFYPPLRGRCGRKVVEKFEKADFWGARHLIFITASKYSFPTYRVDCALATENMLLAAHDIGLGACLFGTLAEASRIHAIKDLILLPPHHEVITCFGLGFPAADTTGEEKIRAENLEKAGEDRENHDTFLGRQRHLGSLNAQAPGLEEEEERLKKQHLKNLENWFISAKPKRYDYRLRTTWIG